jgi:hypothetical protein
VRQKHPAGAGTAFFSVPILASIDRSIADSKKRVYKSKEI